MDRTIDVYQACKSMKIRNHIILVHPCRRLRRNRTIRSHLSRNCLFQYLCALSTNICITLNGASLCACMCDELEHISRTADVVLDLLQYQTTPKSRVRDSMHILVTYVDNCERSCHGSKSCAFVRHHPMPDRELCNSLVIIEPIEENRILLPDQPLSRRTRVDKSLHCAKKCYPTPFGIRF